MLGELVRLLLSLESFRDVVEEMEAGRVARAVLTLSDEPGWSTGVGWRAGRARAVDQRAASSGREVFSHRGEEVAKVARDRAAVGHDPEMAGTLDLDEPGTGDLCGCLAGAGRRRIDVVLERHDKAGHAQRRPVGGAVRIR